MTYRTYKLNALKLRRVCDGVCIRQFTGVTWMIWFAGGGGVWMQAPK